jgi:hypothetical protein
MALLNGLLLALAFFLAGVAPGAAQGSPAQECDRLAAETDGAGNPAVPLDAIDAEAALAACAAALEEQPADPRLAYQYGRALERAGRLEDARRLYAWAAAGGLAPAEAALQRLSAAGDAVGAASAATPAAEQDKRASEGYAGLAAALRRYAATLPQDPSDPLTVLAAIGSDPETIFRWVSENTRLVAYPGSLRGARGVLLDRAGNSLDRALLLAALLRGAGQEVRLAHATLDDDQARALLPATERTVPVPALPQPSREELVAMFAGDPRLDRALVERAADDLIAERRRIETLVEERLGRILPVIRDAVAGGVGQADAAAMSATLSALADHFWIELRTSTGWRPLDPDGGAVGNLQPTEILDPARLPDALRQAVSLRLILELQDDEGRHEEKLLDWSGYPADLIDRPIVLQHIPRMLSTVDQVAGTSDAARRMIEALDAESAWMPVLQVGDTMVADKQFTRDGVIGPADLDAFAATGRTLAGGAGAAAGALDSAQPATAVKPAIPTAEWLETEIRVPGAEPVVQRRTIFDLVGPAARDSGEKPQIGAPQLRERALRLLGSTEILITGATPSSIQLARVAARDLAIIADNARGVMAMAAEGRLDLDSVSAAPERPLALYTFASERLSPGEADGRAITSPNIVLLHQRFSLGDADSVTEAFELDIVSNEVGATRQPYLTRLAQGVADTVREATVLAPAAVERNAAALLDEDLAAGRRWSRLEAADLSRLEAAGVPPDYRARVAADLKSGFLVVAPDDIAAAAAAGRLAWWRIDPRTGTTLGMLPDGGGADLAEEALHYYHLIHKAACWYSGLGVMIGHANAIVGVALCIAGGAAGGKVGGAIGVAGMAFHLLEIFGTEAEGHE